jgi:pyrroline-5-carboxylate reductase
MLQDKTIGFIGAGNMAEALLSGLLSTKASDPAHLICSDVRAQRRQELSARYGVHTTGDNLEVVRQANVILFAVKPQNMAAVLQETAGQLDDSKVIISIAAGVPLSTIAAFSNRPLRLLRAMPNVCAMVKAAATAVAAGPHARVEDLQVAETIFNAVGRCISVPAEHLLDAVTGLSGSGPAYVFVMIEALADGGVKMGLNRSEAQLLAAQTLLGAARMQLETGTHPGQLKDMVSSPGGTTIAGLHVMEKAGVRGTLAATVEAATIRAKELGAAIRK